MAISTKYGFILGQIEGLTPSVKTITLTIADRSMTNTDTLSFNEAYMAWEGEVARLYEFSSSEGYALEVSAFEESDVGDTYNVTLSTSAVEENFKSAVETVLVDNGLINALETLCDETITITTEDVDGVEIPFNMDVSSYPFKNWTVTINGLEIPYQADFDAFQVVDDNIGYGVFDNDGVYTLQVINLQDESYPPVPGDYQVKITTKSESGGSSGLPAITEADEGKQLTVVNGEWSKNGYITEAIERRDTSVSPNITYTVQFHRQGKLVRVHSNIIPISLFTDIVIPQGYRPADHYDGTRQLILNVGDNSVEWVQFDTGINKFSYSGSSTGKFLIDFTYFTYNAFPTE
jgi:hypothetical protein